ncbi:MAG TPA: class I SAM-dependent methyltransferase [Acidimicrobiales bacterium]|jgi:SAM-dependent methyltransferase
MDDDLLQAYYARDEERDRLARGTGRLEFLRTVDVIERTLPPAPAVVADIGGGPGRYTDWLIDLGHTVIHRDLVADHVQQVRSRHSHVDTRVGDARSLDLSDSCADAVLLLGPIYHLRERSDRVQALREARRIVATSGVVYVGAISRWGARLDGILCKRLHQLHPRLLEIVDEAERTGWVRAAREGGFTCATHTHTELRKEVSDAGFDLEAVVTVEGIAFALEDLDARLDDPVERTLVLDTLRAVESVPDLIGVGPHLLATARS